MILRSIFSHWGRLRDSCTTITKGENIFWCSRRQHNALRARGCTFLNRMMICKFFSFCLTIIFVNLVLYFRSYINTNTSTISTIYPDHPNLKSLPHTPPPSLNGLCGLFEHQKMFSPFVIVVHESLSRPQCENMDLKIIVIFGKGSNKFKFSLSSITTPRFLAVFEGVMVDEPNWKVKLRWNDGIAETTSSSVLARLSWRSFIQQEMSTRHAEKRAAIVRSSGWNER